MHSLILVGVSTVAELVVSSASPFNIAEELQLPYFTETEVRSLIEQYVTESGQSFEEAVIIRYQKYSYLIETKMYSDETYFKKGKGQLVKYLKSEKLEEGYYVVFSHQHSEQDECFTEEIIQGKRIYTLMILLKFEQPSRLPVPNELKLTESEKVAVNLLKMGQFTIAQIAQATCIKTARIEQLKDEFLKG